MISRGPENPSDDKPLTNGVFYVEGKYINVDSYQSVPGIQTILPGTVRQRRTKLEINLKKLEKCKQKPLCKGVTSESA